MSGPTEGYCRIGKWKPDTREAQLLAGLSAPDADDWTYGAWTTFRDETDAREFVKRWNAHEDLVAALTNLVAAIDGSRSDVAFAVGVAKRVLARVNEAQQHGG